MSTVNPQRFAGAPLWADTAAHTPSGHALDCLLRPRSIAIVGASGRTGSFGQQLQHSIASLGYAGKVFLINSKYAEIDGVTSYPSLAALPQAVDCVALAIADAALPAALEAAAAAQAGAAVLFGRAYGASTEGKPPSESLTDRLAAIAADSGMALCGGNCMGFVNLHDRLQLTGFPIHTLNQPGSVALVSHSGSTWSGLVANQRDLRFNYAISAGQELATGMAEYLDFLLDQPSTRVICLVLETVRRPEPFLRALSRAQAQGVAVIALKLGRSRRGQAFAQSHSGAMAGSAEVYDAIFARHGVIAVHSLDELLDTAELFAAARRPHNGEIGLGCDSGGERQLIADLAEPLQLPFADLAAATVSRLEGLLEPGVEPANPLDYWGDGKDVIADALLALASDPSVGTLVMASNIPDGQDFTQTCTAALSATWAGTDKPVVLLGNLATSMAPSACAQLRRMGIPVLMGTATGLRALKHFSRYQQVRMESAEQAVCAASSDATTPTTPTTPDALSGAVPARIADWRAALSALTASHNGGSHDGGPNKSLQNFDLLEDFGLPVAAHFSTASIDAALAFAQRIGYPLVAKIDAPAIAHKSEVGGVLLGIADDAALRAAYAKLQSIAPGAVLLQQQLSGTELILGMQHDAQFGPTFTLGLGGIYVEILKDFVTLLPTASRADISASIRRLKGFALLNGARGRPPADLAQLSAVVQRFMQLGWQLQDQLQEMEINPLLVDGVRIAAVDFLAIPRAASQREPLDRRAHPASHSSCAMSAVAHYPTHRSHPQHTP